VSEQAKDWWFWFGICCVIAAFVIGTCGCSLLGIGEKTLKTTLKPSFEKLSTDIDKSKDEISGTIQGDYTKLENRMTQIETNIVTMTNNIKNVRNSTVLVAIVFGIFAGAFCFLWWLDLKREREEDRENGKRN